MRLTRVTLFFIALIIGTGLYLLMRQQLSVVEPQTYQATEESMVDAAQLLAASAPLTGWWYQVRLACPGRAAPHTPAGAVRACTQ